MINLLNTHKSRTRIGFVSFLAILAGAPILVTAVAQKEPIAPTAQAKEVNDRGAANRKKLASIIIPKIEFEDVSLRDAIKQLNDLVKENDPENKGVLFNFEGKSENYSKINLQLSKVPASDALKFITSLAGTHYWVKSVGVEIGEIGTPRLWSRQFRVPAGLLKKIATAPNVEAYWEQLGAVLEDGSAIKLDGQYLSVENNAEANLELIENHIKQAMENGDVLVKTPMEKKLDAIVVPVWDLKQATVEEAVDLLRRKAIECDPTKNPKHRGVNVLIRGTDGSPATKRVTMLLKNSTLKQIVDEVAKEFNLEATLDPLAVILREKPNE